MDLRAGDLNLFVPVNFLPGRPCPEPSCTGHLEADDDCPIVCIVCSWVPDDNDERGMTAYDAIMWMSRCATESIEPRTTAARKAADVVKGRLSTIAGQQKGQQ